MGHTYSVFDFLSEPEAPGHSEPASLARALRSSRSENGIHIGERVDQQPDRRWMARAGEAPFLLLRQRVDSEFQAESGLAGSLREGLAVFENFGSEFFEQEMPGRFVVR